MLYPISHRLCRPGQDLLDQISYRDLTAQQTGTIFFRLFRDRKALHAGGGKGTLQSRVLSFAHGYLLLSERKDPCHKGMDLLELVT